MSPLLVGFLGVLGGALMVAFCHGVIVFCNDRRPNERNATIVVNPRRVGDGDDVVSRVGAARLEHRTVHVTVVQSKSGSKEEVCAVCLGEFKEGEGVRVLRECSHVFHVSCIDKWVEIHRNCPLCRASAVPPPASVAEMDGTPPEFGGNVV